MTAEGRKKLFVVGTGLIGASIASAARKSNEWEVGGFDENSQHLETALSENMIDRAFSDMLEGTIWSDLVVLALPIKHIAHWVCQLDSLTKEKNSQIVLTDTGSVKHSIIDSIEETLGEVPRYFVPGHPMAGLELSGPANAKSDLFVNKSTILTPKDSTCPNAIQLVKSLWESLGSRVIILDDALHDRRVALVSHFPHVMAYCFAETLENMSGNIPLEDILAIAGPSLKDATRTVASNPDMWHDIFLENKEEILQVLGVYAENLLKFKSFLEEGEVDELKSMLAHMQQVRKHMFAN